MKPSKTDYRGGAALRLASKALELVVTTDVGPRVASFRSTKSKVGNLFLEFPADEQPYNGFMLRGGHRLWHAPEDLVRTYQPDDSPLTVRYLANRVALRQPVEEKTGIEKGMWIEFVAERSVRVTHTLANRGLWVVETAPWAITIMPPGGYGVVPLLPKGSHEGGDLLPNYSLVPWTYTDLSRPEWALRRDCIGIDVTKATEAQKLGLTNYPGWSAYWREGATFVKHAAVRVGATYPDLGCAWEIFTNGKMLEFETLAPIGSLAPGKTVQHVEHWTIIEGLPKPDTEAGYAKLRGAVDTWLKTL